MKKYLPFILLGIGVLVVGLTFFFINKNKSAGITEEEEVAAEIPVDQRPYAALIPSMDGHWLKMKIEDIKVSGASSMDYELLYKVSDGRTQGIPGTIQLNGQTSIERNLLLGSESSGKFRYDEGVQTGTLTLKFRNDKGKLLGKLSTEWKLSKLGKNYVITMDTFSKGEKTFTSSSDFVDGKSTSKSSSVPND